MTVLDGWIDFELLALRRAKSLNVALVREVEVTLRFTSSFYSRTGQVSTIGYSVCSTLGLNRSILEGVTKRL